jgi:hypothetical protein
MPVSNVGDKVRNMKSNVKKGTAFLLILAAMLFGISEFINKAYACNQDMVGDRSKNVVALEKEKKDSIDVLVIGDSESYTTISPMKFWNQCGITSFVGGQSGQQLSEAYNVFQKGIENQSPKLVMIETNMFYRRTNRSTKAMNAVEEFGNRYFSVFTHHGIWKKLLDDRNIKPVQSYKGFQIRTQVAAYEGDNYMRRCCGRRRINGAVKTYVDKIVHTCKEKNIDVLFYSAPSPKNYNYKKHNAIKAYADKLGVAYVDLNLKQNQIGIDWKRDTLDRGDHLNIAGAEKVSNYMIAYVNKNYDLPDHRNESGYTEWNKLAENYNREEQISISRILAMNIGKQTGVKDGKRAGN